MDIESLKRRCSPRDDNDHLFVIPIAEVRELLDAYEQILAVLRNNGLLASSGKHCGLFEQ